MTHLIPSTTARSYVLPTLTIVLAIAVFAADVLTPPDCVVSGLYVVVVLMAGRFCTDRGLILVAIGCAGLAILAQFLSPRPMSPASPEAGTMATFFNSLLITGAVNTAISIVALSVSTFLVLRGRSAEAALRQAHAELARISRATTMGELTASLAHEVNQPISAAITSANACLRWLSHDIPNLDAARAAANRIVRDGTRAAEIVDRLRVLFKKGTSERKSVDIDQLAQDTLALLREEAARHSITIRTELAAQSASVMADRVQIQQVLVNLLVNGIEAMKSAPGPRDLVLQSQRGSDGEVVVSVGDSGAGLPERNSDQIFEAFFTTKPDGTGMGLSISRSIVMAHGGRLWAMPNRPRGAVFLFALPVQGRGERPA